MKKQIALIFSLLILFSAKAQKDVKRQFDQADAYFVVENYPDALPIYEELLSNDAENPNLNFLVGVCYLNSAENKEKSIAFLQKAVASVSDEYVGGHKEKTAPQVTKKHLADAFHINYKFEEAVKYYKEFLVVLEDAGEEANKEMIDLVNRQIASCSNATALVAAPINIKIENLGENINSPSADYAPVITADESALYFTSRRKETTGGKKDVDGMFYEDIYVSYRNESDSSWLPAKNLGSPINTEGHEATIGLSVDGQKLLIYKDDNGNGNIYISELEGEAWSYPQKMNENVNSEDWEPSASISADASILYFASNREGGLGGKDIYMSKKLPNGEWAKAINLGPTINTPYDEDGPYIHPDGITLFFSSQGHKNMGGFDIFFTTLNDNGEWETPTNMGYPVNTTGDDVYYMPSSDNKRAYYSSFRPGGFGEKDIYLISFTDQKAAPLTVFKGTIQNVLGDRIPENIEIVVTDKETGELIGQYYPNSKTGKYLFILTPGKEYEISYLVNGEEFNNEVLNVPKESAYNIVNNAIDITPVKVGAKIVLRNIFYDFNKATLQPASKPELDKLFVLLDQKDKLVVEISGHTDSKGNDDYNEKLSQKRAEAVVNYLIKKGIPAKRLVAKGYGESQPIAPNTFEDGSDNEEGRALNRRTEFRILSTGENDNDEIKVEKIDIPEDINEKK